MADVRRTPEAETARWMAGALLGGVLITALVYVLVPTGRKLVIALDATARWSFVWFWLASVARPLAALTHGSWLALARRARELGLAYAAAHLAHVAVVGWMLAHSPTPFPRGPLAFFGIGVVCTYGLALLSFEPFSTWLEPRHARLVRAIGVEYISLAFIVDFIGDFAKYAHALDAARFLAYVPFQVLAVAGPLLRLGAAIKRAASARRVASEQGA